MRIRTLKTKENKMKKLLLITALICTISGVAYANDILKCGTIEELQEYCEKDKRCCVFFDLIEDAGHKFKQAGKVVYEIDTKFDQYRKVRIIE